MYIREIMDDFIDPFLSSSSWSELNKSSRSSWDGANASQSNGLIADTVEEYGDEKNPPMCMIPSPLIMGNVATEGLELHAHSDNSSSFTNGNLKYLSQHELAEQNSQSQLDNETHETNFSLKEVFETNSASGSYGRELNTSCSVALPHNVLTMSSSNESSGSEMFGQSLGDGHSISSIPSMWPLSYSGFSSYMEQGKLQGFGFQGMESDADELGKTYIENGVYPHLNNSAVTPLCLKI